MKLTNWTPQIAPIFLFVCLKLNEKDETELGFWFGEIAA